LEVLVLQIPTDEEDRPLSEIKITGATIFVNPFKEEEAAEAKKAEEERIKVRGRQADRQTDRPACRSRLASCCAYLFACPRASSMFSCTARRRRRQGRWATTRCLASLTQTRRQAMALRLCGAAWGSTYRRQRCRQRLKSTATVRRSRRRNGERKTGRRRRRTGTLMRGDARRIRDALESLAFFRVVHDCLSIAFFSRVRKLSFLELCWGMERFLECLHSSAGCICDPI
jgi:hypothetical protein